MLLTFVSPFPLDAKENITSICPECLTFITPDSRESMKAVNLTLNKFNEESDESRYFAAAKVIRALSSVCESLPS